MKEETDRLKGTWETGKPRKLLPVELGRTTRFSFDLTRPKADGGWIVSSQPVRDSQLSHGCPGIRRPLRWILQEAPWNRLSRCNHRLVWKLTIFEKLSCPPEVPIALGHVRSDKLAWPKVADTPKTREPLPDLCFTDRVNRASIKRSLVIGIR